MDLEFDLCGQNSVSNNSDVLFGTNENMMMMQELVWKRIHIEYLPHNLLSTIMKFLDIRDIFYILNRTSRDFYSLITHSPFRTILIKSIFKRSTGLTLNNYVNKNQYDDILCSANTSQNNNSSNANNQNNNCILEEKILKTLLIPNKINSPIAFYGYSTNGGFDQLQEYWIDTAFIKGLWSICTKEGTNNVNIAGSTLADPKNIYATHLKNYQAIEDIVCKIANYIKHNYNGETLSLNYIKRIFYGFSLDESEQIEKLYLIQCMSQNKVNNECMIGLLKISIDLYQKISLCRELKLCTNDRVIEDKRERLLCEKTVNILTGVQISREGFFSCPVRTLFIFGSHSRIQVNNNHILDTYNDIKSDTLLESLVMKQGLKVIDTNLHILRNQSVYYDDQTDFKFAVFSNQSCPDNNYNYNNNDDEIDVENNNNNNGNGESNNDDIYPIAWVQYTCEQIDYICLQFRRMNYFNCKHVAVKLIDCDNRIKENDKQLPANIDFNYIQFKGIQLLLNNNNNN